MLPPLRVFRKRPDPGIDRILRRINNAPQGTRFLVQAIAKNRPFGV